MNTKRRAATTAAAAGGSALVALTTLAAVPWDGPGVFGLDGTAVSGLMLAATAILVIGSIGRIGLAVIGHVQVSEFRRGMNAGQAIQASAPATPLRRRPTGTDR